MTNADLYQDAIDATRRTERLLEEAEQADYNASIKRNLTLIALANDAWDRFEAASEAEADAWYEYGSAAEKASRRR